MDPNDDNSLFTFINNLTSIPLEKEDISLEESKAQRLQALTEAFAMNSSSTASNNTFHNNNGGSQLLLQKKFKGLSIAGDQCANDLNSTGNGSDKSLSSFGSDGSADGVNCGSEQQQSSLFGSPLIGLMGPAGNSAPRESSQSPANSLHNLHHNNLHNFFGFQTSSNSNSSSPPLSHTASAASSSSASSGLSEQGPTRTLNGASVGGLFGAAGHIQGGQSTFSFNNLASKMAFNSVPSPNNKVEGAGNAFSTSNPLDSIFSSLLNGSGRADTTEPVHTFSSILDGTSNAFVTSSSEQKQNINNLHRRHFGTAAAASSAPSANGSTLQQLMPNNAIPQNATTSHFTSSQDVPLPHSFFPNGNSSNSYSQIFSAGSKMERGVDFINSNGSAIGQHQGQQRKAFSSLFNGGGSLSSNNNGHNNASSISSLTNSSVSSAHSPLLSSANFLNFDNQTAASSSTNNQHNHNNHQQQLLASVNGGGNQHVQSANMQARFEGHIRALASEINATVQLYTSSIEIRKEQLIKQLDHVRNTYLLLLKQQSNGKSSSGIAYPRIVFARPDPSHLKVATSFGHLNSPAFAPYCQPSGEGLSVAIEGEPSSFVVATRNCFNEEMLTGGEIVEVEIQAIETNAQHQNGSGYFGSNGTTVASSTSSISSTSSSSSSTAIQRSILDCHNGKYTVTYVLPRGANVRSLKVLITVNGLPVASSPYLATVKSERVRQVWRRVALFGEEGTGAGQFCRPWGVALCRLPLVRDPAHKTVGGESSTSTPVHSKPFFTWNTSAADNCSTRRQDYVLAVADRSNNRIQLLKLSVAESTVSTEAGVYTNGGGTSDVRSLNNRRASGNGVDISVMHVFGSGPGLRNGQFDRPAGIAINSNLGQIVVVDKDNHRIQSFDMAGNYLFKFGEKGSRAGQFCYPWDVAICSQTSMILVSDTRNRRIQLFTHFGQYIWHCGQPLDSPRGVAFLSPDRYIVSDFNKHRLLIIDRNESSGGNGAGGNGTDHHQQFSSSNSSNSLNNLTSSNGTQINSKYIGFGEGSAWGEFLRPQGLAVSRTSTGSSHILSPNHSNHGHQQQHSNKYTQIICADSRNSRIAIWSSLNQSFEYICEEPSQKVADQQQQQHSLPPGLLLNTSGTQNSSGTSATTAFDRPSGLAMADNMLAVVDFGNNRLQVFQRCLTTIT